MREKILWNEDWLFCAEPLPARAFSVKGPLYKQAKTERAQRPGRAHCELEI